MVSPCVNRKQNSKTTIVGSHCGCHFYRSLKKSQVILGIVVTVNKKLDDKVSRFQIQLNILNQTISIMLFPGYPKWAGVIKYGIHKPTLSSLYSPMSVLNLLYFTANHRVFCALGQLVKQASALTHERGHASPQIVTSDHRVFPFHLQISHFCFKYLLPSSFRSTARINTHYLIIHPLFHPNIVILP